MRAGALRLRDILILLNREATPYVTCRFAWILFLIAVSAVLTAASPVALKIIVDGFNALSPGFTSPLILVALYVTGQWLARAAAEIRGLIHARVERRMLRTLSERLMVHIMHLPLRFHLEKRTGAISESLDTGLQGLQIILHHLVFTVLPVTIELATVTFVLWRLAPPLFLGLFCATLTLYAIAFGRTATTISKTARTASDARVEAGAAITDSLLNYETIKYFAAEILVQTKIGNALARSEAEWITFYRGYAGNGIIAASIFAAFLAATTWYSTLQVQNGRMSVGTFVLVNAYMLQVIRPIELLGYALQEFSQGMAMLENMLQLFREEPESPAFTGVSVATGPATLAFEHVSVAYRPGRHVLTDVSFLLPPMRTLGIVGRSGSGKSTIVRLLVRLLEPDDGRILLDDAPLSILDLADLRSAIAVVPQDTMLFNDTIAYNITVGRADARREDIELAARAAHLHDFIMTLPKRYDTLVGERGARLSGGEKQRISIARAVLKSPRLYVFDEATSSLDSRTEQEILDSLREVSKHSSTLVIAHRLSAVVHADEIALLEGGTIIERGTHHSLLRQNGRYADLWNVQQAAAQLRN